MITSENETTLGAIKFETERRMTGENGELIKDGDKEYERERVIIPNIFKVIGMLLGICCS